jgi:hypothetical protein
MNVAVKILRFISRPPPNCLSRLRDALRGRVGFTFCPYWIWVRKGDGREHIRGWCSREMGCEGMKPLRHSKDTSG